MVLRLSMAVTIGLMRVEKGEPMREKLIELLKHDDCPVFLVIGGAPEDIVDYLLANGVTVNPVVPGREMGWDMAERCYRNGEEAMREKVISYLRDQKGITMGAIRSTLSDAIEKVRKL